METLDLNQGSEQWLAVRSQYWCASDAAAALGLSKRLQRNDLLHMCSTAGEKEFSAWVKDNLLAEGRAVEALARPIAEKIIGQELYPVTGVAEIEGLLLLASFDGLTITEDRVWESKMWNADLVAAVRAGDLPDEHWPQVEQQLLISGAPSALFTVTDGTEENTIPLEYVSRPERRARLIAAWKQFEADLAAYTPVEFIPAAVAEPVRALPALAINITGNIALTSNLDVFGAQLKVFIAGINQQPATDQDFANAEAACKTLATAQERLEQARGSALAQISTVDEVCRTVEMYSELARTTRLMLEKLVKARKEQVRVEIHDRAKKALAEHIELLNTRLGRPYMPVIVADFAGAMRSKRTISSLQNGIDTELANAKIQANAAADRIGINLNTLRELAKDHAFLFADTAQIVLKETDHLTALVKLRISEHRAAEEKRLQAERDRIRAEEAAKVEAENRARAEAEAKAREAAERARVEAETRDRQAAEAKAREEAAALARKEAEERAALQAQLDAERAARENAERRAKLAELPATAGATPMPAPAARAAAPAQLPLDRPTDLQIINAMAMRFGEREQTIIGWLRTMDLDAAAARFLQTA